jgi:ParB family chromosome partitioning protein
MTESPFQITEISINDIIFPANEMRTSMVFEDLDELARSIKLVGLLNPVSVRPKDEKYELIAGFRRIKACEILGMITVPCRIINSSDAIADLQKAHENIFRENINPVDEGRYFKILLEKHDWKLIDLAAQLHRSPAYISRRITVTESDPYISQALKDLKINLTVCEELNKITNENSRRRLLGYCIQSGATADVVRSWRVQANLENLPPPEKEVIKIDPNTGEKIAEKATIPSLNEDNGPERELSETVHEYRTCYVCLAKIDVENVSTLFLCPTCKNTIEKVLLKEA